MNFSELRNELKDRGFEFLGSPRLNRYLNKAYHELCDAFPWPFLSTTSSAVMPQTITDLGIIESVINTTNERKLDPEDRRTLTDSDPNLDTTGTALFYYKTSEKVVAVYPANTSDTFEVQHWKIPSDLEDNADIPVVPSKYQYLIVDGAARKAYQDSDNFEAAREIKAEYQNELLEMAEHYDVWQIDKPDYIDIVDGGEYSYAAGYSL